MSAKGGTMLEIQTTRNFHRNMENAGDLHPCAICGKGVRNPRYWVHIWYGNAAVTEEEAAALRLQEDRGDGDTGMYPIGPDCLRRHPEYRKYIQ